MRNSRLMSWSRGAVMVAVMAGMIAGLCLALFPVSARAQTERLKSVLIFPLRGSGVKLTTTQKDDIRNYLGTRLTIEGVYKVMPCDGENL